MRRSYLALAAATVLLGGCYRITVNTGAPPTATTVDKPFVNYFVYGLVPPSDPLNVGAQCPQGVSQVITEQSFVNGLVAALTWQIYSPQHFRVTCAGGPVRTSSVDPAPKPEAAPAAARVASKPADAKPAAPAKEPVRQ